MQGSGENGRQIGGDSAFRQTCRDLAWDVRHMRCRTTDPPLRDLLRRLAEELETIALRSDVEPEEGSDKA